MTLCMLLRELEHNYSDEIRMTKSGLMTNEEARSLAPPSQLRTFFRHSTFVLFATSLRFPLVDQNVITKLLYFLRNIPKKVIGSICRNDIYQGDDAVVLIEILVCPSKNQLLGFGAPVPGCTYRYRNEVPWASKLDLADHFFLHPASVALCLH